jgi:hypothetical protein
MLELIFINLQIVDEGERILDFGFLHGLKPFDLGVHFGLHQAGDIFRPLYILELAIIEVEIVELPVVQL